MNTKFPSAAICTALNCLLALPESPLPVNWVIGPQVEPPSVLLMKYVRRPPLLVSSQATYTFDPTTATTGAVEVPELLLRFLIVPKFTCVEAATDVALLVKRS